LVDRNYFVSHCNTSSKDYNSQLCAMYTCSTDRDPMQSPDRTVTCVGYLKGRTDSSNKNV